jgi:DNA-binding response OmpR family regulator
MNVQTLTQSPTPKFNGAMLPKVSPSVRVIWLKPSNDELPKTHSLLNKFLQSEIQVQLLPFAEGMVDQLAKADLLLVEAGSLLDKEIHPLLNQIRLRSRAPVMLLTDHHNLDWSIATLTAGADAVVSHTTPDEVIVARCKALLRRWPPRT